MTFDQLLLLGAIIVPAALGIIILVFFMNDHTRAKRLAWIAFTFPFIAGIFLFVGLILTMMVIHMKYFSTEWVFRLLESLFILD